MAITSSFNSVCLQTVINMFGIDPLKFNCLYPLCIDYHESGCEEYWTQHFEHGNLISREELAMELYMAELEVASFLGQFPFPTYVCDEHIEIDSCYRDRHSMGVNLEDYTFATKWKCVQDYGVFENTILGSATVEYVDQDGDGLHELAEVTFDYSSVTYDFNVDELMLTFIGFDRYNDVVCPILSVVDNTATSTITFYVDSWNLVRPELYLSRSFQEYTALDACDLDNYVTELNVCAKLKTCAPDGWVVYDEPGCTSHTCDEVKYPFCVRPVNKSLGLFKITLGDVDEDGCFVDGNSCPPCGLPKRIEINYISSCNNCLQTKKDISFCNIVERAIIYIAVSRLPRSLCECGCSTQHLEELKFDTAISYDNSSVKFNYPYNMWSQSPFGTKVGELTAYKLLTSIEDNMC